MSSLNLFNSRFREKQKTQQRLVTLLLGLLLVVVLAGSVAGYYVYTKASLEDEVSAMVELLNSPTMAALQSEMFATRRLLSNSSNYLQELQRLERAVAQAEAMVSIEFMEQIMALIPPEVTLDSFTLSVSTVSFNATAPTLRAVADLNYSLRQSGMFTDVYIGNVSGSRGNYSISFSSTLR